MENQILFIQNQIWWLIAVLVATNIICYIIKKTDKKEENELSELLEKNKIEELIKRAEEILIERPNSINSLYFASKAYAFSGNYSKAIEYLSKYMKLETYAYKDNEETLEIYTEKIKT